MVWEYPNPAEPRHTLSERSNRARELEMVASHANVEGLHLPPDLIELAYDRNNGDLIDTIMNLTEPIFRRQLEQELAERQAEQEDVLDADGQRELDLWLLESQVPGCTRELAERAYAQGCEDVERALPLARVTTLLADREAMVEFIVEQIPSTSPTEADIYYDGARGDVVNAVANLQREAGWRRPNHSSFNGRSRQRLRMRTVFMLALLYRERYGELERVAEEALAERARLARDLTPFRTADGSQWTHTRDAGWRRRPPAPTNLGRAVRATVQLADAAAARGHVETAIRARRTADGMRAALAAATDDDDEQAPPSPQSPLPPPLPTRSTAQRDANGLETWSTVIIPSAHYEHHRFAQAHSPIGLRDHAPEGQYQELRDQDADNTGSEGDPQPPALVAESSSSSEAEEDDGTETPTAGTYARPRPFVRAAARIHPRDQRWEVAKRNLRIVQEQLDTEMASAVQGVVMSEGGYIAMMNAIKTLWEQLSPHPDPDPVEVN
jgi:hypothetical protein